MDKKRKSDEEDFSFFPSKKIKATRGHRYLWKRHYFILSLCFCSYNRICRAICFYCSFDSSCGIVCLQKNIWWICWGFTIERWRLQYSIEHHKQGKRFHRSLPYHSFLHGDSRHFRKRSNGISSQRFSRVPGYCCDNGVAHNFFIADHFRNFRIRNRRNHYFHYPFIRDGFADNHCNHLLV